MLTKRIEDDLRSAMKMKQELKVRTLRMVVAALKNKRIELKAELDDESVIRVLGTLVKQRLESAESFRKGNRPEMASAEEAEIEVLKIYLPEQISVANVERMVDDAIAETKATDLKAMGAVMKVLMSKVQGRVDNKIVSDLVRKKLS